MTPEETMWVSTDWPGQGKARLGHYVCSFIDDLDAPPGRYGVAATVSERPFTQTHL